MRPVLDRTGRMRVLELWRYPVKSMLGEALDEVVVGADGFEGDRRYALFDTETGQGLTARRVPELLFASARLVGDGVTITLPDGTVTDDDGVLSKWLGRDVELRASDYDGTRTYEVPLVVEEDQEDVWVEWNGPRGAFHDSNKTRVSMVSVGSLGAWDPRRFRSNVLLDGSGEDAFIGHTVRLGSAELTVEKAIDRCVMVTRPQPGGVERDVDVLKTILNDRAGNLAIGALVSTPGVVRVGDELT
jgi:uncharacterized protein